jgi:hypothetical protein
LQLPRFGVDPLGSSPVVLASNTIRAKVAKCA